jgi:hypothetical protein
MDAFYTQLSGFGPQGLDGIKTKNDFTNTNVLIYVTLHPPLPLKGGGEGVM